MSRYMAELLEYPGEEDWLEAKKRALVTIGKRVVEPPTMEWKKKILKAAHSPIRYLRFSFYLELPYWVACELRTHRHSECYIRSQRGNEDRGAERQDAMVQMIWDMNAEELITIAEKRLCNKASEEASIVVNMMKELVYKTCPEFNGMLLPRCFKYRNCPEMSSCGQGADRFEHNR